VSQPAPTARGARDAPQVSPPWARHRGFASRRLSRMREQCPVRWAGRRERLGSGGLSALAG
jgi:hypothetical protein